MWFRPAGRGTDPSGPGRGAVDGVFAPATHRSGDATRRLRLRGPRLRRGRGVSGLWRAGSSRSLGRAPATPLEVRLGRAAPLPGGRVAHPRRGWVDGVSGPGRGCRAAVRLGRPRGARCRRRDRPEGAVRANRGRRADRRDRTGRRDRAARRRTGRNREGRRDRAGGPSPRGVRSLRGRGPRRGGDAGPRHALPRDGPP